MSCVHISVKRSTTPTKNLRGTSTADCKVEDSKGRAGKTFWGRSPLFLYEEIEVLRRRGLICPLPPFVNENLKHELRPYQREALENFMAHFDDQSRRRPTQVLFHMATGSGKTLLMAALMIYLYRRGRRNFLFFVHLDNILQKTKENFLERASEKYLFAESVVIDGERVPIREVDNFNDADDDAINICFTSIQQLNALFRTVKENAMTADDLEGKNLVLISDEAHHLNVDTKSKEANKDRLTWEWTVKKIFERNAENILLEFTATCDLSNPAIRAAYEDKIVYDYPLTKFYRDGWSKDIIALKADVDADERELMACVLSQYRLKMFEARGLKVKPVILFKSRLVADSQKNMAAFVETIRNLTAARLEKIFELSPLLEGIRDKFSMEELTEELRAEFAEHRCISANDPKVKSEVFNSLERTDNQYRAIFAVDKLNEGWDVLNLFDIVRLYETRQSGKKISPTTISEAQLIGRGARYYPFALDDDQSEYRRKFDGDLDNEMRACEVLYYHCQNDRRYITELRQALKEIGLELDETRELHYRLKDSFKRAEIYRDGAVHRNARLKDDVTDFREKFARAREKIYSYASTSGATGAESLLEDRALNATPERAAEPVMKCLTLRAMSEENYAAVHRALIKFPIFRFDRLRLKFDGLSSTREFVTSEKYLGDVKVELRARVLDGWTMYRAALKVLKAIAADLEAAEILYRGSKEFRAEPLNKIFGDKTIRVSKDSTLERIELTASDDWFAYEEGWGTSEERAFVDYMRQRIGELRAIYDEVYVVRNERSLPIYDFEGGRRFEPDYVIFLRRGGVEERVQIFVEPKGRHLLEHDAWKEKFLAELDGAVGGRVIGLPFFNSEDERKKIFDDAFRRLLRAE